VVRDADGGGIPGARIHADMGTEVKTIVTDHLGRYRLDRLAPGTWRVRAELTGFLSATCAGVIVRGGLDTPCDLTLRVGMLAHSDYVLPAGGLPGAVRAADVIAHVRVIQPLRPATLEQGGVATEHRATVLAVIKGEAADLNTGREIRLWQRGAGDRFEDGYRINSQYPPFFAGEEVVGFFSRGRDGRIQSYLGDLLMFRIVDGKVASRDCCGRPWHGIENGTPLNELLAQLRKLAG
jgi:hypothetical protein